MTKKDYSRFFTNEPEKTLLDRFKQTLEKIRYFDILVAYFRTSGFSSLYKEFESIEKIRILNGMNADYQAAKAINEAKSSVQRQEEFAQSLEEEVSGVGYSKEIFQGYSKFIEYLKSGKIEFRQYPKGNVHAKVYISRFNKSGDGYGRVITGSSNFSYAGLKGQQEFNVELKDKLDVDKILEHFEKLWDKSEDIGLVYQQTLNERTWLNDSITPYELYLKTLFEYFRDEINEDKELDLNLPEGFYDLLFQKEAVKAAQRIIQKYNGVFLSDVVGLGKTYISALLANQFPGAFKIVVCSPSLINTWEEVFQAFGVQKFKIFSVGKLEDIIKWRYYSEAQYVFIDEAHRYRNEETPTFERMHEICYEKKTILVTATPLNNKPKDVLSQLKLIFDTPKRSTIPGIKNLVSYFQNLQSTLNKYDKNPKEYLSEKRKASKRIREEVLEHIMVRRTRSDIINYFKNDIKEAGLIFPELQNPVSKTYVFDDKIAVVFNETLKIIKKLKKARYQPKSYLKAGANQLEIGRGVGLGGFMVTQLVKRLESCFYSFKKTVNNFIGNHERYIDIIEKKGIVLIGKNVNIYDLMDDDNVERMNDLIEKGKLDKHNLSEFRKDFIIDLKDDLNLLKDIQKLWNNINDDPKLAVLMEALKNDKNLVQSKIIIFSESKDTTDYLLENLAKIKARNVLSFSSVNGKTFENNDEKKINISNARTMIRNSFDPKIRQEDQNDDIDTLITTDVLAEGVDLHRSNIVINYDLPWNPTRVIQRVGRINRLGTKHAKLYVYNFFPTEQSDEIIHTDKNIKSKIQAFHDCLGEDAKYLSDSEEVETYSLFGGSLYDQLNNKDGYFDLDEEVEDNPLEYLKKIREIRDENSGLYKKIMDLPKKSRSAKRSNNEGLLTFYKKGFLKKFVYLNKEGREEELPPLKAIKFFKCKENEKRLPVPDVFFDLSDRSLNYFNELFSAKGFEFTKKGGSSNESKLVSILKSYQGDPTLKSEDKRLIEKFLQALGDGRITTSKIKAILDETKEIPPEETVKALRIINSYIGDKFLNFDIGERDDDYESQGEIILSEFLVK